ncbi:Uncharacterised protein [uncultured archaeon]|nr:Uncharacterised protein [uncultured archaeon]
MHNAFWLKIIFFAKLHTRLALLLVILLNRICGATHHP